MQQIPMAAILLTALSSFGAPALAAEPPRVADTIVVRGQREAAFSTPASVQVLSVSVLRDRSITTLDSVAEAVPGLSMINDQDPGTNIVTLRGATTDRLQQAAIALVVDGVPLADTELFTLRQFDLARIEVLKGPQGALFGKNAAGGVIAISNAGADDTGGYVRFGLGNGGLREAEAATSITLGGDWAARLSGVWTSADGWITNRTLNRLVDATETKAVRVSLAGPLPYGWSGSARLNALQEHGGAAWASSNNVTGPFRGRLEGAALTDPIGDYPGSASRSWYQANLQATRGLAGGELSLGLAADTYKKRWDEELDYRPGPLTFLGFPAFPTGIQPIRQPTDVDSITGQARWVSAQNTALRWSLGGFIQGVNRVRVDDFGPLNFGFPPPLYRTGSRQTALLGGIAFDAHAHVTLEAQARFDRDERRQGIFTTGTGRLVERREGSFERLQPRFAASWRPSSSITAYASYGEAFRTGGFNPIPLPSSVWKAEYQPEVTKSVEVGLKLRGGEARQGWQLETAAFSSNVSNYQNYTFIDNNSVTLSVDAVKVQGVEITGTANTSLTGAWGLSLNGGWALTNAEIERFIAPDPIIAGARRNYTGNRLPNLPEWSGSATIRLSHIEAGWTNTASLTVNGAGQTVYEIDNALYSPARAWLDARYELSHGSWTATFWSKNLGDERWAISAFGQGMTQLLAFLGPNGPFDTFTINRGRTFGATVERQF